MRVAVTGASGFIGSRLMAALGSVGIEAAALVGDVRDAATFAGPFNVLIHLAGAMPRWFPDRATEARAINVDGTRQAALACATRNARLVLASTAGVYDRSAQGALGENALLGPPNPYAASKLDAERAATLCPERCALRLFNVYGRGQGDDMLIGYLAARAQAGEPITVHNPAAERDFVHVSDVAAALIAAALAPTVPETVNIGAGVATSVGHVLDGILARARRPGPVERGANATADGVYADISRAGSTLGWHPLVGIEAGLDEVMGSG